MEVEENLEVPLPEVTHVDPTQNLQLQWQDEETVHDEEHMHVEVHVEGEYPMHGGHPLQEGTLLQGGTPAWFLVEVSSVPCQHGTTRARHKKNPARAQYKLGTNDLSGH